MSDIKSVSAKIRQLEAELAEAKEMIACLRVTNDEYGKRSEERLSELAEAKEKYETINNLWTGLVKRSVEINKENAEFKRKILEGELIPASVAAAYYETHIDRVMPLEVFAAEQARKDAQ